MLKIILSSTIEFCSFWHESCIHSKDLCALYLACNTCHSIFDRPLKLFVWKYNKKIFILNWDNDNLHVVSSYHKCVKQLILFFNKTKSCFENAIIFQKTISGSDDKYWIENIRRLTRTTNFWCKQFHVICGKFHVYVFDCKPFRKDMSKKCQNTYE